MQDVDSQQTCFSAQRVQRDFRNGRPVREVEERPADQGGTVTVNLRSPVVPRGGERDACRMGIADEMTKSHAPCPDIDLSVREAHLIGTDAVRFAGVLEQPLPDRAGGCPRRHSVQIGARRCGRSRGIGHLTGIRRGDADSR